MRPAFVLNVVSFAPGVYASVGSALKMIRFARARKNARPTVRTAKDARRFRFLRYTPGENIPPKGIRDTLFS